MRAALQMGRRRQSVQSGSSLARRRRLWWTNPRRKGAGDERRAVGHSRGRRDFIGGGRGASERLQVICPSIKTRINRLCQGARARASRIVKDLPGGGSAKDEELKKRHAELVKTQDKQDGTRTWSEAHRRIVRKTSLEIETLDADARRVSRTDLRRLCDLTFAFEAVALEDGRASGWGRARCAAVLTSNRKCARCKVANYCSRDRQARHWDTHKATVGRPTRRLGLLLLPAARRRAAAGRAANLEGASRGHERAGDADAAGCASGRGPARMRAAVADVPQAAKYQTLPIYTVSAVPIAPPRQDGRRWPTRRSP